MDTIEKDRGPREIYKHGNKKKMSSMLKSNTKTMTDREEILNICGDFYRTLYQNTMEQSDSFIKSQDTEQVPPFKEEEIENVLRKMTKIKAPGNDGITSDVILAGSKDTIKYITQSFNEILKSQIIPDCWLEAKIIILFKKGDRREIKTADPSDC